MTLYDAVIKRRQRWRQEGFEEGRAEGRIVGRIEGRDEQCRANIAAILARPDLSDAQKVRYIAILNSDSPPAAAAP